MSYKVLSLKWRPQRFEDVIGQKHVTQTLTNAINLDKVGQAYLFTGPRGVGKTTTARILAMAINSPNPSSVTFDPNSDISREIATGISMDVIEIDGASNRGIEEIRNLREQIKFSPMNSKFKIIIIDEVHMLTTQAFNALLTTLEEPPAHGKFIFATTDIHKVPSTIISRFYVLLVFKPRGPWMFSGFSSPGGQSQARPHLAQARGPWVLPGPRAFPKISSALRFLVLGVPL